MCELLAMSSLRPARLTFSLEALAARGSPTGRTHDGWGAAFYQGKDAALFREPTAAGDSPLVQFLESQGPSTTLAISHIRRATRGEVTLSNTQPFLRELAGRAHVFAHNGNLPNIEQCANLAYDRYHPVGTTDSEHAFCALLERVRGLWELADQVPALNQRLAVIFQFAADLRKLGPANFLYSDGDILFAHGDRRIQTTGKTAPPGLHLLTRRCMDADEPLNVHGVSITPGFQEVLLVASVPLTDGDWQPVVQGNVLAISAGQVLANSLT